MLPHVLIQIGLIRCTMKFLLSCRLLHAWLATGSSYMLIWWGRLPIDHSLIVFKDRIILCTKALYRDDLKREADGYVGKNHNNIIIKDVDYFSMVTIHIYYCPHNDF